MTPTSTTAERLQHYAANPAAFRADLIVDADSGPVRFGEIMDPWQREDFEAMDSAWLYSVGRTQEAPGFTRAYLERSRGHSKSTDLAVMATWALAFAPRTIRGAAAAGDRDQARLLRDSIERLVRSNPWLAETLTIQNYRVVNRRTGSQLDILASDSATAYGLLLDFLCIDEITNWPTAGDKLWHALASTIAKRRHCLCVIISNAGTGQGTSWQWKAREVCRESPQWHFSRLDGPVASWITPDLLKEQERLLPPPAYRRLWLNRWTSGTGDCLTPDQIDRCTTLEGPIFGPGTGIDFFVGGLDLGWRNDRTGFAVLAVGIRTGKIQLAHCIDWDPRAHGGELPLELVEQEIMRAHGQFNLAGIAFDPREAVGMAQRLCDRGIRMMKMNPVPKLHQEMVQALLQSFTEGSVELYAHAGLRDDLLSLSLVERSYGLRLEADRTDKGHADLAISFVMALTLSRLWLIEAQQSYYGSPQKKCYTDMDWDS